VLAALSVEGSWSLTCRFSQGDLCVVGNRCADEKIGGSCLQQSLYSSLLYDGTSYYIIFILIGTKVYRNFLSNTALMNKQSALWWPDIQEKSYEAYPDPDASPV